MVTTFWALSKELAHPLTLFISCSFVVYKINITTHSPLTFTKVLFYKLCNPLNIYVYFVIKFVIDKRNGVGVVVGVRVGVEWLCKKGCCEIFWEGLKLPWSLGVGVGSWKWALKIEKRCKQPDQKASVTEKRDWQNEKSQSKNARAKKQNSRSWKVQPRYSKITFIFKNNQFNLKTFVLTLKRKSCGRSP